MFQKMLLIFSVLLSFLLLTFLVSAKKYSDEIISHKIHGNWLKYFNLNVVCPEHKSEEISLISSNRKSSPYFYCVDYNNAVEAKLWLQSLSVQIAEYYTSLKDDIYCFRVVASDSTIFQTSPNKYYLSSSPLFLKLDKSYISFFSHLFETNSNLPIHPVVYNYQQGEVPIISVLSDGTDKIKKPLLISLTNYLNSATFEDHSKLAKKVFSENCINNHHSSTFLKHWEPFEIHFQKIENSLFDFCHFNDLQLNWFKQGFSIKLSKTLLNTLIDSTKHQHIGVCISVITNFLLQYSEIARISLSIPYRPMNQYGRAIIQTGSLSFSDKYINAGLNGSNVLIGLSDTGIDEFHCFFKDYSRTNNIIRSSINNIYTDLSRRKIVQYVNFSGSNGDYQGGHGTHVAGSLAGSCDSNDSKNYPNSNTNKGMASNAKIAFFDLGTLDNDLIVPEHLSMIYNASYSIGAKIHSNSWGGGYFYDAFSIDTDSFLYEHQDFITVFAGGNSGSNGPETVLSPSIAKNALAIGCSESQHSSSQNINYVAYFSSQGPTLDGRIKPDVVAPGFYLTSSSAQKESSTSNAEQCFFEAKSGTSMATPMAAGAIALIQQYFEDDKFWASSCNPNYSLCQKGAFSPSGPLLKALTLHSGSTMTASDFRGHNNKLIALKSKPDNIQGYGRIYLENILSLSKNESNFDLFIDTSSLKSLTESVYTITITSTDHPLKATISWYDPPNDIFATKLLLNDLDLVFISPTGDYYFGNMIQTTSSSQIYYERDELNNNEQIFIETPSLGTWSVRVQAKTLTTTEQKFALVITTPFLVTKQSQKASISTSVLNQCKTNAYSSKYPMYLSLWSRTHSSGWGPQDFLQITSISSTNISTIESKFNSKFGYSTERLCVSPSCYKVDFTLTGNHTVLGSQASIPQCGIFLAPLAPYREFCFHVPPLLVDSNETSLLDENSCKSMSISSPHFYFPMTFLEINGVGWTGSYLSIIPLERHLFSTSGAHSIFAISNILELNSAVAETMEWGLEEEKNLLIPLNSYKRCYLMHLSIPSSTDEFPTINLKNNSCPLLNASVPLASFCIHDTSKVTIDFYSPTNSYPNVGQSIIELENYQKYLRELEYQGSCELDLEFFKSENVSFPQAELDTYFQVDYQSSVSVIVDESYYKLSSDFNLTGMEKCFNTSDLTDMSLADVCYGLLNLFANCDSYSFSQGLCAINECANHGLSWTSWCSIGAITFTFCPQDNVVVNISNSNYLSLNNACLETSSSASSNNGNDGNSGETSSAPPVLLIIIFILAISIIIFGAGMIWYNMQKLRSLQYDQVSQAIE